VQLAGFAHAVVIGVLPQSQGGEDGVACVNQAVAVAAVARLVIDGEGEEAVLARACGREIRLALAVCIVGARPLVTLRRRRGCRRGRRAGSNEKVRTGVTLTVTDGIPRNLSTTLTGGITIMHVFRRNRRITLTVAVATQY
jgi:hypothetical protein